MQAALLEHANITVTNPDAIADALCQLFNWHIRWSGPAKDDGYTVHVGSDTAYLALYKPKQFGSNQGSLNGIADDAHSQNTFDHTTVAHINHLGIVVENLDEVEKKVFALGFDTFNHGDYEPGRRFYFMLGEGLEAEVVSYTSNKTQRPPILSQGSGSQIQRAKSQEAPIQDDKIQEAKTRGRRLLFNQ
tara:strand:- start:76 stop:642 length:567 start_codon:yes stop_codon:yes gene_type:complete